MSVFLWVRYPCTVHVKRRVKDSKCTCTQEALSVRNKNNVFSVQGYLDYTRTNPPLARIVTGPQA